ncbi:MAG: tetratricopeptide repeat protein [Myxococcales bacterium]|nr:tetratricopeptide repeat protein [Myxococcales bacterium]
MRNVKVEVKEEKVEGGIAKVIQGYERFLAETPESPLVPEAMRRLADLKVEKEYGIIGTASTQAKAQRSVGTTMDRPERYDAAKAKQKGVSGRGEETASRATAATQQSELQGDFEKRATVSPEIIGTARSADSPLPAEADLEKAGPREAIELYKKLLAKYPLYDRKDQVLYHMSRAYEELGDVEQAMTAMNRLVKERPDSKYFDEVQFRRGEYFFTRKKFLDAEDAYRAIVDRGVGSSFYELALYKVGWTFYKQELYEEALPRFFGVLDYKMSTGFDFENSTDGFEKKRVQDTYRVISLSLSNLGGPKTVADYFGKHGKRTYEANIYQNLGEFYLDKRRYNDAALTYKTFVGRNPFDKISPHFDMRVIEIYRKGAFPRLVIDSSKEFARNYDLKSEYWKHFDPQTQPEVVGYLKQNLRELADYYHALYQDKRLGKEKEANFKEALVWYREFLDSFPRDADAPAMNYQLADLLLENKAFGDAALEYERTAYDYPAHEKAAAAGYAAVYAHREALKVTVPQTRATVKQDIILSSLRFADTFPRHGKTAVVLGAAADDLYEIKDYERAIAVGRKLITQFQEAEPNIRRGAWLVVAHSSLELGKFEDAEKSYTTILTLIAEDDKTRTAVIDNLALSVYKQGEQANKREDYKAAAEQFLRVATLAPTSKIRPTAEYDGATALLQLKEWNRAVGVLQAFRKNYPGNDLQREATKKIAFALKEAGNPALAAAEYERVETETKDDELRRGALALAAELYEQAGQRAGALRVYRRYVKYFPKPLELAIETRHKVAQLYKSANDTKAYLNELREIVDRDARAGNERTDRTRYLAALSTLALTEPLYEQFVEIKLLQPFEKNLARKRAAMKKATHAFGKLPDYQVGEVTAASAFYIAEIYYRFGTALADSERPKNLTALEREQYELVLEEQVYPFEEKAISLHEKNLELLGRGVYNAWIDKSIARLAKLVPARYAKFEESMDFVERIGPFRYEQITQRSPSDAAAPKAQPPQDGKAQEGDGSSRQQPSAASAL